MEDSMSMSMMVSESTSTHEDRVNDNLLHMSTFLKEVPNLRVPAGFHDVLEGFSMEVLRAQPEDVIAFAVKYFEEKLNKRPGRRGLTGMKKK